VFERFTERARQVVVLAQEEARSLSHNYIGTEHILLGLLREEEGMAARALESLQVTVERVRSEIRRLVGAGEEVTSGQIPFTPRAKTVLEMALREALSLGHNYIGTEHILLGLVRENDGVAARILLSFDLDPERIRNEVIRTLAGPVSRAAPRLGGSGGHERIEQIDGAWLGGLATVLRALEPDIERTLDRLPDSGDLLLALASAPDTRAAQALRAFGIDLDALAREVGRVRAGARPSAADLVRALDHATEAKRAAATAEKYEDAAQFFNEESRLRAELSAAQVGPETIPSIRARLGLAPPKPPPEPPPE
jgi:ATP-dependent Clp protease ATP-binding subunit ClpA